MTQPTSYQGDKKYQTHLYRFGAIRSDALMHQINFADGYRLSRDPCGIDLIMPLPAPAKGCVASA